MNLKPPATIGVIGGGQLGMFIAKAAKSLGYRVAILDPSLNCPAKKFADQHVVAGFFDPTGYEALAGICDVLTYEFEHIDAEILKELERNGTTIIPSPSCLSKINDKYMQKMMLQNAGIPVADFAIVEGPASSETLDRFGLPMVFKRRQGGYDGKGYIVADTEELFKGTWEALINKNAMIERFVQFERELSMIVARDHAGNIEFYQLVENVHQDGILRLSHAPAQVGEDVQAKAREITKDVLAALGSPGLFCVEMFLDQEHNLFVNEIAPRPHNSGHHTIDACRTSQYEQLVRILTGMPLGSTEQTSPCAMVNVLGPNDIHGPYKVEVPGDIKGDGSLRFHWYGKDTTAYLRKLGHFVVLEDSVSKALLRAEKLAKEKFIRSHP